MLNQKPIEKVVFIDLESTSQYESFALMPVRMQNLFKERFKKEIEEEFLKTKPTPTEETAPVVYLNCIEAIYDQKAPLFAEWNKIICISMGRIDITNVDQYKLNIKSFINADEKQLLTEFAASPSIANYKTHKDKDGNVKNTKTEDQFAFCSHNGFMFDFPVIAKRMIYNGLDLPFIFDYPNIKPWELVQFIDTKKEWSYNVFDGGVSLDLLAACFDVESSKTLMKGSDVKNVYYETKDMTAIQKYCEHDIYTLASIYLKMKGIKTPLTR